VDFILHNYGVSVKKGVKQPKKARNK